MAHYFTPVCWRELIHREAGRIWCVGQATGDEAVRMGGG